MADAIVSLLLENLSQVLVKEASSLIGEDENLRSLDRQLKELAISFEKCKDLPNELLNQIRELAYDIENAIDHHVIFTYEVKNNENRPKFLYIFGKQATRKGVIVKKMKDIEKRTNDICARIRDKLAQTAGATEVAGAEAELTRYSWRAPAVEEAELVGITNDVDTLVNKRLVGGDSKLAAISVVGMGGLGKTTVAKKVYDDLRIRGTFQLRAWVYVSQKNTPEGIVLNILKFLIEVSEEMKQMNKQHLGEELRRQLKGKKYLIVMDDVWKLQVWEDLKPFFPNDNVGSRILFTTRMVEVAKHAADADPENLPHHLRLLNAEESWELFHKKALPGETCPPQWEKIGRKIAEKCGGLPLAIVILGRLLSLKEETFDEWSRVNNQVSTYFFQTQAECKESLALSYKELPYYLKPCFLYMSAFPEDHQILARLLIDLWIAEGLIRADPGETMEDAAERYLEMLASLSLIQVVERKSNGGVKKCSIHRVVRDICISETQQQNFLQVQGSADSPLRRLAITDPTVAQAITNPSDVKELRTLLCFTRNTDKSQPWDEILKAMRLLKVFKVSNSVVSTLENQLLLRYFSLDENSVLQDSSSLCNLPNLLILNARSKSAHLAFDGIWKMRKLRRVYFQGPIVLPQPPVTLPSDESSLLKDLQTLSNISPGSCTPEVFQKIPNLLKLGVKGDLNGLPSENLKKLKNLRRLILIRTDEFPPLISLPLEMLSDLTKLTLCNTELQDDPMILLGSLKNLQTLKLSNNVYPRMKLICMVNGFPKLKHLKLVNLESIRQVLMVKSALPNLERFIVDDCRRLEWLTGVHFLAKLQVLDLQKPTKMLRRRMQELNKETQLFQLQIYPLHENEE